MKIKPYQTSDDGNFWDYNFKIRGIIFEISVDKKFGDLYIIKDENQNNN